MRQTLKPSASKAIFCMVVYAIAFFIVAPHHLGTAQTLPSGVNIISGNWFGFFQPAEGDKGISRVLVHMKLESDKVLWSMETPTGSDLLPVNQTACKITESNRPSITKLSVPGVGNMDVRSPSEDGAHLVILVDGHIGRGTLSLFRREVRDINHPGYYQLQGSRGFVAQHGLMLRWGEDRISGTLFLPKGIGPFPVAILSPGGPEAHAVCDRPFDMVYISHICATGIAVFAFDDPGTGRSSGDKRKLSLDESKDQLLAWAELLRSQSEIRPDLVAYIGISEGAMVAERAALDDPKAAFLIYIAGPHDLEWLMCRSWQKPLSILLGDDVNSDEPLAGRVLIALAHRATSAESPNISEAVNETIRLAATAGLRPKGTDKDLRVSLETAYRQFHEEVRGSSWFSRDPDELLADLGRHHVPMLIIAGTRDDVIPIRTLARTKRILANIDCVKFCFPEATHSLTDFGTPLSDHPYDPSQLVSPFVLKTVSEFASQVFENKLHVLERVESK